MKKHGKGERNFFLSCIMSQAVCFSSGAILLFLFTAIAYSTSDPDSLTHPLALGALYLSTLTGGIAAARLSGDGIASGLLAGAVTAAVIFCLSALPLPSSALSFPTALTLLVMLPVVSALGAVVGRKKEKIFKKTKKQHGYRR